MCQYDRNTSQQTTDADILIQVEMKMQNDGLFHVQSQAYKIINCLLYV